MNSTSKLVVSGILILVTIVFGFLIHKYGKPYNTALFTIHKLTTLGFVVLLSFLVVNYSKMNTLSIDFTVCLIIAILSLIGLFVSGALMSLEKLQNEMLLIHRIATPVFVVCIIYLFWRLLK